MRTATALLLAVACGGRTPTLSTVSVAPNSANPLSALVTYEAAGADCVRVVYESPDDDHGLQNTPCKDTSGQIAVVGLLPGVTYQATVEAWAGGHPRASSDLSFTAGTLPPEVAQARLVVSGKPLPGYLFVTYSPLPNAGYGFGFDPEGRPRWFAQFPLPLMGLQQQENGDFTTFVGRSPGFLAYPGSYVEMKPSGEVVRTFQAPGLLYTDPHELRLHFDAHGAYTGASFFAYTLLSLDQPAAGGVPAIAVHRLLHERAGGVDTIFDSEENVSLADRIEPPALADLPDLDHPNALDMDPDGNYAVSWRDLGEIDLIDAQTGFVKWRLGGSRNQFAIVGDPLGGFSAQHSVRFTGPNRIALFDNGWRHDPPQTRAVEYQLDLAQHTATMVWQHATGVFTPYTGSVQRLSTGETLVGIPNGTAELADAAGATEGSAVFMVGDQSQLSYRMLLAKSLYEYEKL